MCTHAAALKRRKKKLNFVIARHRIAYYTQNKENHMMRERTKNVYKYKEERALEVLEYNHRYIRKFVSHDSCTNVLFLSNR